MLGISGLFIQTGKVGGAEYMLYNLLEGLAQHSEAWGTTLFIQSMSDLDPSFQQRVKLLRHQLGLCVVEVPGRANRFIKESVNLPLAAHRRGLASVLFANYYTPPTLRACRSATVIHDLQYKHLPEHFSVRKRLWLNVAHRATLRHADHVVVISNFVRSDVLNAYGSVYESKLRVIPNPIAWDRFERASEPASPPAALRERYILSVASHYPHKNLGTLLRAFASVRHRIPHALVLAGQVRRNLKGVRPEATDELAKLVEELAVGERLRILGHVPDARLGSLYRGADLFVLPSMFEGFGMPAVEALGMGVPTLTTNCAALPEATLGKATYITDPLNVEELAWKMLEMIERREAFVPSAEEVRQIRAFYAPARIAREYMQVLERPSAS
jgi:glycosyltransferase involved in cell wall biosynthesis